MQVKSKDGAGFECGLFDSDGDPVAVGDKILDRHGDTWKIDGGAAPQHISSTGKVYVTHVTENFQRVFYPGVLDLHWQQL